MTPIPILLGFLRDARGGATAIAAAMVTVMTVGGAALLGDHLWLIDQRDTLKTAADAASIAATLEVDRQLADEPDKTDADLKKALEPVAKRYIEFNLAHLPADRLERARDTLKIALDLDRSRRTVGVRAEADLGGTLLSRHLPLLDRYEGPKASRTKAGVESEKSPVEVVLAIDISVSMLNDLQGKYGGTDPSRIKIVKEAASQLVEILDPGGSDRVAVGIVPWHQNVRLDAATARTWKTKGWARYPTRRRYEFPYLKRTFGGPPTWTNSEVPAPAVVQDLPDSAPEAWRGCLDEERMDAIDAVPDLPATSAGLLAKPASSNAFAQAFFPAAGKFVSYQCVDPPTASGPFLLVQIVQRQCFNPSPSGRYSAQRLAAVGERNQWSCKTDAPTILPLSTDRTAIDAAIASLSATGFYTHSALGVLWGHRLLLPSWKSVLGGGAHPVDESDAGAGKVRKAIVLLTDGEDTVCGLDNPGCDDSPLGVARSDACAAAKAAGIEIFVIAAMHPDKVSDALGAALRACSSQSDNPDGSYVFLNNSTQAGLRSAFADIGNQLRTLRRIF